MDVTNLSAASSGHQYPAWSFQVATGARYASVLYSDGCKDINGTVNCTSTCLDRSRAFLTLESLHNCVFYDRIADPYAKKILNNNDTALVHDFDFQESAWGSSVSQDVNSTVTACLRASCNGSSDCIDLLSTDTEWGDNAIKNSNFYHLSIDQGYCTYVARPSLLNTDIGGIGVCNLLSLHLRVQILIR